MLTYRQPFAGDFPITQRYGETVTSSFHTGIDYACPLGTPILASADGGVMAAGWDATGFGNRVIILHDGHHATLYAHLQTVAVFVNQKVQQGDVIGMSGSTGNSTGPHLHFEARTVWSDYKSHFDPMTLPLMSVDDAQVLTSSKHLEAAERLPAGVYRVGCEYAFIRTWDGLQRDRLLNRGERVYIFDDVKVNESGLPFHFIGAGRCIAEYDIDGTRILERD